MSKYTRYQGVVSRNSDEGIGEDHWLKQFEQKLHKGAVQPRSVENSLYDQINSIMNGKSRHQTVDAAVQDMMQRSGLNDYLEKVKVSEEDNRNAKFAQLGDTNKVLHKEVPMEEKGIPIVIKKCPSVRNTLENHIKATNGNMPLSAIISHVQGIHSKDVSDAQDWEDDNLIRLVSKLNLEAKKNNPASFEDNANLGKRDSDTAESDVDPSNTDAFNSLMPAKI
jgi:hypothetical protein